MKRHNHALYREIQDVIAVSFKDDDTHKRTGKAAPTISTFYGSSVSKRRTRRGVPKTCEKRTRKQKKSDVAKNIKYVDSLVCLDIPESTEGSSLLERITSANSGDVGSDDASSWYQVCAPSLPTSLHLKSIFHSGYFQAARSPP